MHPICQDPAAVRRQLSRAGAAAFAVVAAAYGLQFLLLSPVLYVWPEFADHPWFVWIASSLPMYGGGIPIAWLMLRRCPTLTTPVRPFSLKELGCACAVGYALLMGGNLLGTGLMTLVQAVTGAPGNNLVAEAVQQSDPAGILLFAVILAPLAEEFLFRGLLYDRLAVFGPGWAVVLTALLFGLFHGNFYQLFYAAGVGLVLGWLKARTGQLRWGIALHMVINFMGSLVPLWLMDTVEGLEEGAEAVLTPELLLAAGYALFLLWLVAGGILVLLKHRREITAVLVGPELPGLVKSILTAPGMILVFVGSIGVFLLNIL